MFDQILARIIGVITLKPPTYREIADDQTATNQAILVYAVVTLIQGFMTGLVKLDSSGASFVSFTGGILQAIIAVLMGFIALVFTAWVLATVANALGGKTATNEMLRVTGYVQVFSLVSILNILVLVSPALGCLTGLIGFVVAILSIVGYMIGVREAAEFTTGKAIITAIIAAIVNFLIVTLIVGAIVGALVSALSIGG